MGDALTAAGVLLVLGNLSLLLICWRRRTALGGVLGAVGAALAAFAIGSGPTRGTGGYALLVATGALVIGTALYALGQVFERLLEEEREDAADPGKTSSARD